MMTISKIFRGKEEKKKTKGKTGFEIGSCLPTILKNIFFYI